MPVTYCRMVQRLGFDPFSKYMYLFDCFHHHLVSNLLGLMPLNRLGLHIVSSIWQHLSSYTQLRSQAGSSGWPCLVSFVKRCFVHTHMHPRCCSTWPHCTSTPSMGLRQGCPLSATLFGLFIDGLHHYGSCCWNTNSALEAEGTGLC